MSDPTIALSALAKFHREVIVPDIQRIVDEALSGSEGRLRNEMQGFHDSIVQRLGTLETESAAIKIGLKRVEDRLDKVEQRLDSVEKDLRQLDERLSRVEKRLEDLVAVDPHEALRADVQDLRHRMDALHQRVDTVEKRIDQD